MEVGRMMGEERVIYCKLLLSPPHHPLPNPRWCGCCRHYAGITDIYNSDIPWHQSLTKNPAFPIHCQPLPCIVLPPCLEAGGPLRLRPRIKSFGPFHLSFMTKTSQPFAEPLKIGQFTITLLHHLGKVRSRLSQLVSNCPEVGNSSSNFWGL